MPTLLTTSFKTRLAQPIDRDIFHGSAVSAYRCADTAQNNYIFHFLLPRNFFRKSD